MWWKVSIAASVVFVAAGWAIRATRARRIATRVTEQIPLPRGAKIISASAGNGRLEVQAQVSESPDALEQFYAEELAARGWSLERSAIAAQSPGDPEAKVNTARRDDSRKCVLVIGRPPASQFAESRSTARTIVTIGLEG